MGFPSPPNPYEYLVLELSWAWQPMHNSRDLSFRRQVEANTCLLLWRRRSERDLAERLKHKLSFDELFYVDGGGTRGGLALLRRDCNTMGLLTYSPHIDV